jgi:hypothetical protein
MSSSTPAFTIPEGSNHPRLLPIKTSSIPIEQDTSNNPPHPSERPSKSPNLSSSLSSLSLSPSPEQEPEQEPIPTTTDRSAEAVKRLFESQKSTDLDSEGEDRKMPPKKKTRKAVGKGAAGVYLTSC